MAQFTRQHYAAIAKLLGQAHESAERIRSNRLTPDGATPATPFCNSAFGIDLVRERFLALFGGDNSAFDFARFERAIEAERKRIRASS